jgi:septal ring factor EnvC (AmiA/AmiB activator)
MANENPADLAAVAPESALSFLSNLAAIFADPAKLQREIKQLQNAQAAAAKAQAGLVAARAKHEQFVQTTTAELNDTRAKLAAREVDLIKRESLLKHSPENLKDREETLKRRSGTIETFHTGMTREFVNTAPDVPNTLEAPPNDIPAGQRSAAECD